MRPVHEQRPLDSRLREKTSPARGSYNVARVIADTGGCSLPRIGESLDEHVLGDECSGGEVPRPSSRARVDLST